MCAISIDRYFIIMHAFVYTQRRNGKLMFIMILIVWLLSALTSIPPLFGWGRKQKAFECTVSDDLKYQIYATLLAFYLPSALMIIVYINIYKAARKIKKREMETAGRISSHQTNNQVNYTNNNINHRFSVANNSHEISQPFLSNSKNSQTYSINIQRTSFQIEDESNAISSFTTTHTTNSSMKRAASSFINIISNNSGAHLARYCQRIFQRMKCWSRINKTTSHVSNNQKATMTLGVIMGCFILCWLPFFILAVLKPIRVNANQKLSELVPKWLDSFLLWLGYFNSALNPMIYARFNREFRRPFIEILCFRCRNINEKLRDEERQKMYSAMFRSDLIINSNINNTNIVNLKNIYTAEPVVSPFNQSDLLLLANQIENNEITDARPEIVELSRTIKVEKEEENEDGEEKITFFNESIISTIEIETIKEKHLTIKLTGSLSKALERSSNFNLNIANESTNAPAADDDCNDDQDEEGSGAENEKEHKVDETNRQYIYEPLLNNESSSKKSDSSLNSTFNTVSITPIKQQHQQIGLSTSLLNTSLTVLSKYESKPNEIIDHIDFPKASINNNRTGINNKFNIQRSKTSKKRKIHSNFSKQISNTCDNVVNFKNKNSDGKPKLKLAYCTYNRNNSKKAAKRLCLTPSIISRISSSSYFNNNNINKNTQQMNLTQQSNKVLMLMMLNHHEKAKVNKMPVISSISTPSSIVFNSSTESSTSSSSSSASSSSEFCASSSISNHCNYYQSTPKNSDPICTDITNGTTKLGYLSDFNSTTKKLVVTTESFV